MTSTQLFSCMLHNQSAKIGHNGAEVYIVGMSREGGKHCWILTLCPKYHGIVYTAFYRAIGE